MRYKKIIKSIIKKTGYELRKMPKKHLECNDLLETNLIVEFIGPSGVGKTTHLEKFKEHTSIKYQTGAELFYSVPGYIIKEEYVKDYHIYICENKITKLLNNQNYKKLLFIKRLKYFIDCIYIDLICLQVNKCVINDEGIFHNFTNEFIELAEYNVDLFSDSLINRAFINITGDPEKIYNQILERQYKILPEHETSKINLLNMISDSISSKRELLSLIKSYNIPCLELNIGNDYYLNIRSIDNFIKSLI